MYERNTVLTLKKPFPNDEETGEVFPYNEVRVIGESPISYAGAGEWSGMAAQGVIIEPTSNFGSNLDEPLGKLQALYDVKELPAPVELPVGPSTVPVTRPGPTPEDVFAGEAPGVPPAEGEKRGRTRPSPLDDPRPVASDGPLGPVPVEEVPPTPEPKPSPLDGRRRAPRKPKP